MAPKYLTTSQAAEQIGVAVSTLQSWAAKGRVTPKWRTLGGQARWDLADLKRQLGMPPNGQESPDSELPGMPSMPHPAAGAGRRLSRRPIGVLTDVLWVS